MKNIAITGAAGLLGSVLAWAAWSAKAWPFCAPDSDAAGRALGFSLPPPSTRGLAEQERRVEEIERRYLLNRTQVLAEMAGAHAWDPLEAIAIDEAIRRDATKHPVEALGAVFEQIKEEDVVASRFDQLVSVSIRLPERGSRSERRKESNFYLSEPERWMRTVVNEWIISDAPASLAWLGRFAPATLMYWAGKQYEKIHPSDAVAAMARLNELQKPYFIAGVLSESDSLSSEDLETLVETSAHISGQEAHSPGWQAEAGEWDLAEIFKPASKTTFESASMGKLESEDYFVALREWVRKDAVSAQRYASGLDFGTPRSWIEMQVGLRLNDDDWAKTNAWLLHQEKDRMSLTMQVFWTQWVMWDFETFEKYRLAAPKKFQDRLTDIFLKHHQPSSSR